MTKFVLSIAIIFFAVISCSNTNSEEKSFLKIKNKITDAKDEILIEIVGIYEVESESAIKEGCDLKVEITKVKSTYYYTLTSAIREKSAELSVDKIENSDELALILNEIQWSEYKGDISNEKESKEKELKIPVGINATFLNNEIIIQNYGNDMNYYVQLGECSEKYIRLVRK